MFKKILIANRGEIALRVLRACRELNIKTVAINSEADENAMHVRLADESICVGPSPAQLSYLNIPAIITAATMTNVDAIHPGYGFLSENQRFVEIIEEHGYAFIGPKSKHIEIMGNKIKAKQIMEQAGVPTVPGIYDVNNTDKISEFINKNKLPVIIKAASGGGGKGMRIVHNINELENSINAAKLESKKSFNDDTIYIEKYIKNPKHIEIQILADQHGNVVAITQTLGPNMGSKVATKGLGFLYNVTMGPYLGGYLGEDKPGDRASSHISPTLFTNADEVVLALGAAGGQRIITAITQVAYRYLAQNSPLSDALYLPRYYKNDGILYIEDHLGINRINAQLFPNRYNVERIPHKAYFGRVHAVALDSLKKLWVGSADPDWEGTVSSYYKR